MVEEFYPHFLMVLIMFMAVKVFFASSCFQSWESGLWTLYEKKKIEKSKKVRSFKLTDVAQQQVESGGVC